MDSFWDSSAVVALLLREPHTAAAQAAWAKSERIWCWQWLVLEVEAALGRRRAAPQTWSDWARVQSALRPLDLEPGAWDALRVFNRALRLRAADAAHLFVCERASQALPGLRFVCFDAEMNRAARNLGLVLA